MMTKFMLTFQLNRSLDEAPVYILEGEEKDYNTSKNDYTHIDVKDTFFKLLKHPTIASKHYLYDQYDQQVGANTIIKPGLSRHR